MPDTGTPGSADAPAANGTLTLTIADWREMPGFIAVGVAGRDGHQVRYRGPRGETAADVQAWWGRVESNNQLVRPRSFYRHQRGEA